MPSSSVSWISTDRDGVIGGEVGTGNDGEVSGIEGRAFSDV
jgi:hypothetical protein